MCGGRILTLVALLGCLGRVNLNAQLVRGSLVDKSTHQPIDAAFVSLLDERQAEVARALTTNGGTFLLRASAAGHYRLRFKRIGFQPSETPPFKLEDGETLGYRLEVEAIPVRLPAVTVRGRPRCGSSGRTDAAVAQLWEEAREALATVRWTEDQGELRYTVERFERQLPRTGRMVVAERHMAYSGKGEKPFRSIPVAQLAEHGYVVPGPGDVVDYYAPDADVLLGDTFLDTHCFSAWAGGAEHPGLVGLAFEPEPGRKVPDVVGVLWLEQETSKLRFLEFKYTVPRDRSLGGQLDFAPLPSGAWIVRDWWIRTARADTTGRNDMFRRRIPRLIGFRETGGIVSSITSPSGAVLYSGTSTVLEGTVVDSSRGGSPLSAAVVLVLGTDRADTTDDQGHFRITGALDGSYRVVFRHPRQDSLGLDPEEQTVNLVRGARDMVTLAVPRELVVIGRLCPGGLPEGRTVIAGLVRDSAGVPVVDARIAVQLDGKPQKALGATDRAGRYVICDVPAARLTISAVAKEAGKTEVTLEFGTPGVRVEGGPFQSLSGRIWIQDLRLRP